ncbi:hypothetical protein HDU83_001434 [Entophlyctis luteolus]|nr:hypothetical protein HDU83_001434 [Entophlyctis luteolus]
MLQQTPPHPRRPCRPPNAFILFRNEHQPRIVEAHKGRGMSSRDFSFMIGQLWRALPDDQKQCYQDEAARRMLIHKQMFPDYRYKKHKKTAATVKTTTSPYKRPNSGKSSILLTSTAADSDSECSATRKKPKGSTYRNGQRGNEESDGDGEGIYDTQRSMPMPHSSPCISQTSTRASSILGLNDIFDDLCLQADLTAAISTSGLSSRTQSVHSLSMLDIDQLMEADFGAFDPFCDPSFIALGAENSFQLNETVESAAVIPSIEFDFSSFDCLQKSLPQQPQEYQYHKHPDAAVHATTSSSSSRINVSLTETAVQQQHTPPSTATGKTDASQSSSNDITGIDEYLEDTKQRRTDEREYADGQEQSARSPPLKDAAARKQNVRLNLSTAWRRRSASGESGGGLWLTSARALTPLVLTATAARAGGGYFDSLLAAATVSTGAAPDAAGAGARRSSVGSACCATPRGPTAGVFEFGRGLLELFGASPTRAAAAGGRPW